MSWREQVDFQWDDDEDGFVLEQHSELDFYSTTSQNQQAANIILIPSQPIFALNP